MGRTPLHQAVERIFTYSHYRPIKEMLIKGASREIQDNYGRKVVEVIDMQVNKSQRQELEGILGR